MRFATPVVIWQQLPWVTLFLVPFARGMAQTILTWLVAAEVPLLVLQAVATLNVMWSVLVKVLPLKTQKRPPPPLDVAVGVRARAQATVLGAGAVGVTTGARSVVCIIPAFAMASALEHPSPNDVLMEARMVIPVMACPSARVMDAALFLVTVPSILVATMKLLSCPVPAEILVNALPQLVVDALSPVSSVDPAAMFARDTPVMVQKL